MLLWQDEVKMTPPGGFEDWDSGSSSFEAAGVLIIRANKQNNAKEVLYACFGSSYADWGKRMHFLFWLFDHIYSVYNRPKKCRWSTLIETVQHRLKSYFGSAYSWLSNT